ncbi:hypothetical protein L873DRAFT_1792138 [Choiromyces venosus 120613-1]|uniref:Uncharacterized protein n=1 Tax=Choiromyces venosus 120613-1 TaxID=1336337 RepID=A0A3N4JP17_9PEZI|nr:hypothetical protein L873DRAFT_1792138 [Choiromyces venosus 120613-1]
MYVRLYGMSPERAQRYLDSEIIIKMINKRATMLANTPKRSKPWDVKRQEAFENALSAFDNASNEERRMSEDDAQERQLEEDIAPLPKIKRRKKATAPPEKRPPDKTADSLGNPGDKTDASPASASGTGKKTKKRSKKLWKKATQSRNIEDILKKGTKPEDPDETEEDEPRSLPNGSRPGVTGRSEGFSGRAQDPYPYPGSDTQPDRVAPSSVSTSTTTRCSRRVPSPPWRWPSRNPPLPSSHALITSTHPPVPSKNPNHRPLDSTPKDLTIRQARQLAFFDRRRPDTVFHVSEMEIDDDEDVPEKEKEITVAGWEKWNAVSSTQES